MHAWIDDDDGWREACMLLMHGDEQIRSTGRPRGRAPATVVDEEAEVDGQVEVDAQNVGSQDCAEAHRRLQVRQPLDQRAARRPGRRPQVDVDQPVEHVGAHAQLQRVLGALAAGAGRRRRARRAGG